jgi:hypothetical protein
MWKITQISLLGGSLNAWYFSACKNIFLIKFSMCMVITRVSSRRTGCNAVDK